LPPEILFYCLERRSLEEILPGLLERAAERGWRAIIRVDSSDRMNGLDLHLWTYSEQSFLAHGTPQTGHGSRQPVYLTTGDENPNGATVLFLAGGEVPSQWDADRFAKFKRIVVMFDGRNPDVAEAALTSWQSAQRAGHVAAFWRQGPSGKWEQQKSPTKSQDAR
jgi:DNA polymerase-3 subunit chi